MPLKLTPHAARWYLLGAALLIAFPSLMSLYTRYTNSMLVALSRVDRSAFFAQTVIYIGYHNGWGARGLILNKPLSEEERLKMNNVPAGFDWYIGGPVMYPSMQFVLINPKEDTKNAAQLVLITLDEYIKKYPEEWQNILADPKKKQNFRIYLGYSGWGSAQLEGEILRGSWGIINYFPESETQSDPKEIWRNAMKKVLEKSPEKQKGI